MGKRKKDIRMKLSIIFITSLFLLITTSFSYSLWYEEINIPTEIQVGNWTGYWARMNDNPHNLTYEFPGPNLATYIINPPTETPATFYLYESQITNDGALNIHVWNDSDYLYIEYDLDPAYTMTKTQVHVGLSLDDIPQTSDGNPILEDFEFFEEYNPPVSNDLIQIPWNTDWNDMDLYIASHADILG